MEETTNWAPLSEKRRKQIVKGSQQRWDEVYGREIESRKNAWRISYVAWAIAALSMWGMIHFGSLPKSVVIPIEVDHEGHVVNAANLKDQPLTAKMWDQIYTNTIEQFVEDWRSVIYDKTAQDELWDRTFNRFVGGGSQAQAYLTKWFSQNNPHARAADGKLVHIRIINTERDGDTTYRVVWKETEMDLAGKEISTQQLRCRITFLKQPDGIGIRIIDITEPGPDHV